MWNAVKNNAILVVETALPTLCSALRLRDFCEKGGVIKSVV